MQSNYVSRLAAASLLALAAGSAQAADLYGARGYGGGYKDGGAPYPALNWTGFYFGANGGGAWGASSDQLAYATNSFGGLAPSGGFGGGQFGFNWQGFLGYRPLVLGIETDLQGSAIEEKGIDRTSATYKSNLDYFGTVRGRVGYAADSVLLYFTGGFAYGAVKNNVVNPTVFSIDRTDTGYTLGGGLEYKITPAWSIKTEYQYIDLGKGDPTSTAGSYSSRGGTIRDDAFHTARIGVNYQVGTLYLPLH
jgi:outer membrane immunogenic protein